MDSAPSQLLSMLSVAMHRTPGAQVMAWTRDCVGFLCLARRGTIDSSTSPKRVMFCRDPCRSSAIQPVMIHIRPCLVYYRDGLWLFQSRPALFLRRCISAGAWRGCPPLNAQTDTSEAGGTRIPPLAFMRGSLSLYMDREQVLSPGMSRLGKTAELRSTRCEGSSRQCVLGARLLTEPLSLSTSRNLLSVGDKSRTERRSADVLLRSRLSSEPYAS